MLSLMVSLLWVLANTFQVLASPPNVVLMLADDLGSGDIGCYGGPVKTPALDALAAKGVKFDYFYSGAPVCSPARASLLTGRHHVRTGVYTVIQDHIHEMHLSTEEVTIAELLRQNGYETVHVGKWHLGTPFRGMEKPWIDEHGFDYWFATDLNAAPSHRNPGNFWRNRERVGEMKGYACQLVVDEAVKWLNTKRDNAKPFFLNVWFHEPHAPLAAPADIVAEYGGANDQAAIYSATIDNTDRAISRLLKHLKETGELENTIIIYTSDHGSYRHERNGDLRGGKGSLLEGGIRTPGIFYWPAGIDSGRVESTPGAAIDILPTICGLAGIEVPETIEIDGTDLSPVLRKSAVALDRKQPLSWHSPLSQPVAVLREGDYTLVGWRGEEFPRDKTQIDAVMGKMRIHLQKHLGKELTAKELWHECYNSPLKTPEYLKLRAEFVTLNTFQERWIPLIKSGTGGITRVQLFDLSSDPKQTKNIASENPELTERLRKTMQSLHEDVLREGPVWGEAADEHKSGIHRPDSARRSSFDAFAYLNRIPVSREDNESMSDLSGRIASRLANQEGRILIKLPPEMNQYTYFGFRLATASAEGFSTGRCSGCHQLPEFGLVADDRFVPTLRNKKYSLARLESLLANNTHQHIELDKQQTIQLLAFIYSLRDLPEASYRESILEAAVLDTSGDLK